MNVGLQKTSVSLHILPTELLISPILGSARTLLCWSPPGPLLVLWNSDLTQAALEFCPIHCPNGRLGQDLGFGGFAFALKLPELLNRNLAAVRAKLGQTSCFP